MDKKPSMTFKEYISKARGFTCSRCKMGILRLRRPSLCPFCHAEGTLVEDKHEQVRTSTDKAN